MARSKSTSAQTSAYGLACTHCYKAKCRCVRTPNGDDCERCLRLNKRCEPSDSIRRRNAQSADESDTRIARLEDKMETLLSTMQSFFATPESSGSSANTLQSIGGESISSTTSYSNGTLINPSTNLNFSAGSTFTTNSIAADSPNPNLLPLSYHIPSPSAPLLNQADDRLDFFRSRMLPSFPFIDLGPGITSWYLRQNRPILLQAIHTVTTFSTQERLVQVDELKRLLFTSALVKVQSNIDLLLGLLTYLAWSTDAFLGRADLISRLMMLAISVVYDMRLFKPSSPDTQLLMTITQGQVDDNGGGSNYDAPHGLLERQRAVLACFFLSSNMSSHLGRQDALRWTPEMDEALQILKTSKSCPSDELFIFQVHLQLLKQKADEIRKQGETNSGLTGKSPAAASAPLLLYLKTLRRDLREIRSSFSLDLPHLDILNTHAQYVELYINQLGYSISRDSPPLDLSGQRSDGRLLVGFERLQCLWQSVENIKAWLDGFYKIPCSKLVGQPFHFWSQMILSITLLKYLSVLDDPDWDCHAVRNTIHLITTVDCMLQKLDLSSREPELQCNDHLLKYLSKLLSRSRMWTEARWNAASQTQDVETRPCRGSSSDAISHNKYIPGLDQMDWIQSMDLGDDKWFEDVLGMPASLY